MRTEILAPCRAGLVVERDLQVPLRVCGEDGQETFTGSVERRCVPPEKRTEHICAPDHRRLMSV